MDLVFSNITRILTAFAESLAVLIILISFTQKRKHWFLFFPFFALGQVFFQQLVDSWPLAFWMFGMMVNILWMFISLYVLSNQSLQSVLYGTMKAFIFAEFSASFAWLLSLYLFAPHHTSLMISTAIINTALSLIYYVMALHKKVPSTPSSTRSLLVSFYTCVIIFLMSNLGFLLSNTSYPLGDAASVFIFRTMVDSLGLAIIYIQESQRREHHLENEISAINQAMHYQYQQYHRDRQNNTLIDQKVHDLKHQLQLIQQEPHDIQIKQKVLKDIEALIFQYDAAIASGNPVLDTVLTQKNLTCLQNSIAFSCMADGKSLDFMDALDLYSLFGNALDNAIESVSKLKGHQRMINLRIYTKDDFIVITLENPYDGSLEYEDGFPKTTKKDTQYHGYGIKSMSYLVDKYQGHLSINDEAGWFKVKILFSKNNLS